MTLETEIVVVSGLPRSGTSLMMAMLDRGGVRALTDELRTADTDNPRGYYEFERVKQTKRDSGWLSEAQGRAVKVVSALLYDLPASENYRVIFMQRNLDQVLASQAKMLLRRNQPVAPVESMKNAFTTHLNRLFEWMPKQAHIQLLVVNYNELMESPERIISEVAEFLGGVPDEGQMLNAIDPELYRNRQVGSIHSPLAQAAAFPRSKGSEASPTSLK